MKTILSLSGGLDSTSLLAKLVDMGRKVHPVVFTYGSKHNYWENRAAEAICAYYRLPWQLIDLSQVMALFKSNLLKTGGDIPEGHYNDTTMSKTVVPGRNLIFISILAGLAESLEYDEVALAIHAGDHHIYPDCRPTFFAMANKAVEKSTDNKVKLYAPFLHITKKEILEIGLPLQTPYHLTRTCYKDQPKACGKCGSCRERLEAFDLVEAPDPVEYAEEIWKR